MLLDSNIIIGAAKPGGEFLIPVLRDPQASLSIVTRIEALGFHQLAADDSDSRTCPNACASSGFSQRG
jgi:hypothetical protein